MLDHDPDDDESSDGDDFEAWDEPPDGPLEPDFDPEEDEETDPAPGDFWIDRDDIDDP